MRRYFVLHEASYRVAENLMFFFEYVCTHVPTFIPSNAYSDFCASALTSPRRTLVDGVRGSSPTNK